MAAARIVFSMSIAISAEHLGISLGVFLKDIQMSNSPAVAADTVKPNEAPAVAPATPATPQQSQDNKTETKPGEQQK